MNRERCIVCGKFMGNSLHKVDGRPMHVKCEKVGIMENNETTKDKEQDNKIENLKKQMKETTEKVDTYAKNNPWKVAGISAGIGTVIGMIGGFFLGRGRNKK